MVASVGEAFFECAMGEGVSLTVTLNNGLKLSGLLVGFDENILLIGADFPELVCRHAIVSIQPFRALGYSKSKGLTFDPVAADDALPLTAYTESWLSKRP